MMTGYAVGYLPITSDAAQAGLIPTWQRKTTGLQYPAGSPVNMSWPADYADEAAVEIHVQETNGTAPGAGAMLTVFKAEASGPNHPVADLLPGALNFPFDISAMLARGKAVFLIPNFKQSAQYLYLWANNAAMTAGAQLIVTFKVNIKA